MGNLLQQEILSGKCSSAPHMHPHTPRKAGSFKVSVPVRVLGWSHVTLAFLGKLKPVARPKGTSQGSHSPSIKGLLEKAVDPKAFAQYPELILP